MEQDVNPVSTEFLDATVTDVCRPPGAVAGIWRTKNVIWRLPLSSGSNSESVALKSDD